MGFTRRTGTTSRPPIPQGIYDETRRDFLSDIEHKVKLHSIPAELILNSDQTPSSYVSVGKLTMATRGTKSVPIKGLTDKRNITLTFTITLNGEFLPLQVIYSGKTNARGFVFPKTFCISHNPKHWSNEKETLNLLNEVVNPYVHVVKTRAALRLDPGQKALMIWDVFKGQMTDVVKSRLAELDIFLVAVPANMTHIFQPLDLTVIAEAKKFTKKQFVTYYSRSVQEQLQSGRKLEEIEVDLRLSVMKPLHAQWLVSMYDHLTGQRGKEVILKGWKGGGISGLFDSTTKLPPEDPFQSIFSKT